MPFSPLADEAPDPAADAVWLPGGYPELHAGTLAAARRFLDGLRALAGRAVPIHGECGGYMVLGQGMEDADGRRHAMAGLLALETSFAQRRLHIGYRRARLKVDCPLGAAGAEIMGHEFHYASMLSIGDEPLVECRDVTGAPVAEGGGRRGSVSGTFFHAISTRRQAMTAPFDTAFRETVPRPRAVAARRAALSLRPGRARAIDELIEIATHAPSVGLSQPWRFVHVDSAERRLAVIKSFANANERALAGYAGEKQAIYAGLKLAGLKEAPMHLAVFSDDATHTGSGLGRQTMPETLHYSVVAAIQTLWLAARADGSAWAGSRSSIPRR